METRLQDRIPPWGSSTVTAWEAPRQQQACPVMALWAGVGAAAEAGSRSLAGLRLLSKWKTDARFILHKSSGEACQRAAPRRAQHASGTCVIGDLEAEHAAHELPEAPMQQGVRT